MDLLFRAHLGSDLAPPQNLGWLVDAPFVYKPSSAFRYAPVLWVSVSDQEIEWDSGFAEPFSLTQLWV